MVAISFSLVYRHHEDLPCRPCRHLYAGRLSGVVAGRARRAGCWSHCCRDRRLRGARSADPGPALRPLERRRATHLVVLIASLGTLAVIQNIIAAVYTPNILQFPLAWGSKIVVLGGVRADRHADADRGGQPCWPISARCGSRIGTILGKRIRAVASNPFLAEITRLQPQPMSISIVMAIASALVCLPGDSGAARSRPAAL